MSKFKISEENKESLEALTSTIQREADIFFKNDEIFRSKGNKQAAKRARVASLRLFKATKKYRAESMRILAPVKA